MFFYMLRELAYVGETVNDKVLKTMPLCISFRYKDVETMICLRQTKRLPNRDMAIYPDRQNCPEAVKQTYKCSASEKRRQTADIESE